MTLSASDVRYYTVDENGAIDRLILNDATGDLWTYGVLDDVTNLISTAASSTTNTGSGSSTSNTTGSSASDLVAGAVESVMPSTSTLLYGLVDGSIGSTLWESVTSSTASLASYLLKIGANSTTGVVSSVLDYLSSGANYVCYVNGEQTTYKTSVKYPVLAGGISVRKTVSGSVGAPWPSCSRSRWISWGRPPCGAAPPAMRLPMTCRCICGTRASITPPPFPRSTPRITASSAGTMPTAARRVEKSAFL